MLTRVKFQNQLADLKLTDLMKAVSTNRRRRRAWYDARMSEQRFDAVAIGAGPGGYPAALGQRIIDSTGALELDAVPARMIVSNQ